MRIKLTLSVRSYRLLFHGKVTLFQIVGGDAQQSQTQPEWPTIDEKKWDRRSLLGIVKKEF